MRSPAFGAFEENRLLNRLFGEYRLDFVNGPGCALSEVEGRRAFNSGEDLPIACLDYVEDPDAVYKTSVIPKRNTSEKMDVNFSVNLNQIIELNERDQSLLLSVVMRYTWRDDFLTWNPEMHGGIEQIVLPAEDVWTPDIFLWNSEASTFDSKYPTNILYTYQGDALWVPPGLQKSACEVEMELFPFDTQNCTLRYGSWMYSERFISLHHAFPSNDLIGAGQTANITTSKNTVESNEFELLSTEGVLTVSKYDCCPDPYEGRSLNEPYSPDLPRAN